MNPHYYNVCIQLKFTKGGVLKLNNTGYALMAINEGPAKIIHAIDDNIYDYANADVLEYVYKNYILKETPESKVDYSNEVQSFLEKFESWYEMYRVIQTGLYKESGFFVGELSENIVRYMNEKFNKEFKYALWLHESPKAVTKGYDIAAQELVVREYETSEYILADISNYGDGEGYLFAYEKKPKVVNELY